MKWFKKIKNFNYDVIKKIKIMCIISVNKFKLNFEKNIIKKTIFEWYV